MTKRILDCVYATFAVYIGVFLLWLVLAMGCVQDMDALGIDSGVCGENSLTSLVRTIHGPVIKAFASTHP